MAQIRFPKGFHWGTATASYQIEGGWKADGKGESIWDRFAHTPERIRSGDTGDVACDSYHRYEDDVALMRAMNLTSYRFSISWPRIQPQGRGPVNEAGLDYYRRLIDALLAAGIRPFPTLYHWDLPQTIEDAGGWPERDTADRFADYADLVARGLGDRVGSWMIFNEPAIFTTFGYRAGVHAPGRRDMGDFLRATHTVNRAQAQAFRAMKATQPDACIGTAFSFSACEPHGDSDEDAAAAERWHRLTNEWFLRPAYDGLYPEAFPAEEAGAPLDQMGVRPGDLDALRTPLDFIGVNLYSRTTVAAAEGGPLQVDAVPVGPMGRDEGPRTDFGWEVWPDALRNILVRLTTDYTRDGRKPILEVTENGCSYSDAPGEDGRIRDTRRIDFYRGYLEAVATAIEQGADVRGYHAWTLLDNFEWSEGYHQRFGLAWVDFETCERTLKDSGQWFGQVAADNGFDT